MPKIFNIVIRFVLFLNELLIGFPCEQQSNLYLAYVDHMRNDGGVKFHRISWCRWLLVLYWVRLVRWFLHT